MALLDAGNTEFEDTVKREFPHLVSERLAKLITALKDFQRNQDNREKLVYLYKRFYRWIETNPEEFRQRGSIKVAQLQYEMNCKGALFGLNPDGADISAELKKFIVQEWNPAWTPLADIVSRVGPHSKKWKTIEITDLPDGGPGVYKYTDGNKYSEGDRNLASQATEEGGGQKQFEPKYWLRLGKMVLTPQQDGKCYGRCFSCAAAVIYSLVSDVKFDDYIIEHVGATSYDHHLVLIGRSNANGTDGANIDKGNWRLSAIAVDVWQGNHSKNYHYVSTAYNNTYAKSDLKWFCAYPPDRRKQDREFSQGLPEPNRAAVVEGITEVARAAVRDQGNPTRNKKVDGKWIIEELIEGVWTELQTRKV